MFYLANTSIDNWVLNIYRTTVKSVYLFENVEQYVLEMINISTLKKLRHIWIYLCNTGIGTNIQHCLISFFFKFKVVKAIKHFFLKYALYIFNEQIISKLHCSRIKYHRCIMNNWNNVKGQKIPTILSVYNHENKWKGMWITY